MSTLPQHYSDLSPWSLPDERGLQVRGRRLDRGRPGIHFLSGNGFCGGVYWPFLRELTAQHDLVTQDIEGHGESDPTPRFSGVSRLTQRIHDVLDRLPLPSPLIGMGHSFGGALTLRQAVMQPSRFSAIVLLDPIMLPTRLWLGVKALSAINRNPMSVSTLRRRASWESAEAAFQRLNDRGIYKGWTEAAMRSFVDHATQDVPATAESAAARALRCPPSLEASIFANPLYAWRDLKRVQVPVLLVYGEASYPFFSQTVSRVRAMRPDVQLLPQPGGHCFMQERPQATAEAIAGFLAEHSRT
jgi:pimeloyl-ACP methyl ester carboxylesterase